MIYKKKKDAKLQKSMKIITIQEVIEKQMEQFLNHQM